MCLSHTAISISIGYPQTRRLELQGYLALGKSLSTQISPSTTHRWQVDLTDAPINAPLFFALEILQMDSDLLIKAVNPNGSVINNFQSLKADGRWSRFCWYVKEFGAPIVEVS
jgi:hypothetical protein